MAAPPKRAEHGRVTDLIQSFNPFGETMKGNFLSADFLFLLSDGDTCDQETVPLSQLATKDDELWAVSSEGTSAFDVLQKGLNFISH